MRVVHPGSVLGLSLLLAACTVGPDFRAPAAPKTSGYTSKQDAVPTEQKIDMGRRLEGEWWTLFASKELDGLIRKGVRNNYDLAAARETLAQAQEAVKAEQASLLPEASLGVDAGRQKYGKALFGPANFSIPPFTYYEAGPSASWTLDLFGGAHRAVERQQALADYQAQQMQAAYILLTGNIVSTALEMASADAEIKAVGQIVAEDEKTLHLVHMAFAAGAVGKADVYTAQTRLADDRQRLPPIRQRLNASRHELAILLGNSPADWTPPRVDFDRLTLPRALPVSLPSELVGKRPDILAAQANLHAASAAVGVATANLYPHITLSANMLQEALTPAYLFRGVSNAWAVAGGLTAPVFDGGELRAKKREAEHAYRASLAQYRQIILSAFGQVADSLTAIANDEEEMAAVQGAADTAGASLKLQRVSYRAGESGLLQLEDAQRSLARARLNLIRVQHRRYLDCVRLFVALGGSPYKPAATAP